MVILIVLLVGVAAYLIYNQAGSSSPMASGSIAAYAQNAGFSGQDLSIAVAVALAESGGHADAVNKLEPTGGPSYGLWQIHLSAHPEFTGWNLLDPQINANAAYSVYLAAGSTFNPWTTFTTNKYVSFMDQANQQVSALATTDPGVVAGTGVGYS